MADRYFSGIAQFSEPPEDAEPEDLILDVTFDLDQLPTLNGVVTARVHRVLQGDFLGDSIRVGLGNSSCTHSFIFGRKGIIVGRLISTAEGAEIARHWPETPATAGAEPLRMNWPYRETVLVPRQETVEEYTQRTGIDIRRFRHRTHLSARPSTRLAADFDGDGRADTASFRQTEAALVLEVALSSEPGPIRIWRGDGGDPTRFDLSRAPRGVYSTVCWTCDDTDRESIRLQRDGILVTDLDGGDLLLFWTGGRFEQEHVYHEIDDAPGRPTR